MPDGCIAARSAFPGNVIPKDRLNPVGVAIAALYPLPNRSVANQNYVSSPALRDQDDHFDARMDHRLGASDDLSLRFSFGDRSLYEPFSGPTLAAIPGFGTNVPRRAQNAMARETHIFTPNLLNELRLGFDRIAARIGAPVPSRLRAAPRVSRSRRRLSMPSS